MKSLTALIIIVVSISVLYFYAWPQWQSVSELQDKHAQLKDAQFKAQELSKLRNNLVTQYNAIPPEEIEKVNKVIPVQYNPVKLAADISSIALRNGMVIKNVSFVDKKDVSNPGDGSVVAAQPTTPYRVVEVLFSTEGQYKNFTLFLADLEKNLQILDISKVDIVRKTDSEKSPVSMLDFKITLDTYWMN